MTRYLLPFAALGAIVLMVTSTTAGEKEVKVKCPVSGKDAKKECAVDYKSGKVYFCCENCPKAFDKDTKKFAVKANYQLYATGQAKIVKCPFTGRDLNPDTKIKVGTVDVCFCCPNCQGKAEKAKGNQQVELIFNDKAFDKGFKVEKK